MIATASYGAFIREEAALINADGCTGVTNWNAICCLIHDLEYFHGKSATDAYGRYRAGDPQYWVNAKPVSFTEANAHFKACNFRESTAGYFNPFAWIRYGAMRLRKTRSAWDGHRNAEKAQTA